MTYAAYSGERPILSGRRAQRARIPNWFCRIQVANPALGSKAGMNSSTSFGSLGLSVFEPRQIALSLRLRF